MSKIQKILLTQQVTELNFPSISKAISDLTEEEFHKLDSKSKKDLQNLMNLLQNYLKNSGILEAYSLKKQLKSLSTEISSLSYQLLSSHPIPCTFDDKYSNLSYHELEKIAKNQQKMIENKILSVSPIRSLLKSKSHYLASRIQQLKVPNFKLMLFEFPEGISSHFPHEDFSIESHRKIMKTEFDSLFNMLNNKYGTGSIRKLIRNRKSWDKEYKKSSKRLKKICRSVSKFTPDVFEDSLVTFKKSFKVFSYCGQKFEEGNVEFCVTSQVVNMNDCIIRAPIWPDTNVSEFDLESSLTVFCNF